MITTAVNSFLYDSFKYVAIPVSADKDTTVVTVDSMLEAVTVCKNLQTSLNLMLNPKSLVLLAKASHEVRVAFCDTVKEAMGSVKGNPFYVNFPEEVLEKSDFELFMDQLCHYFSVCLSDLGLADVWVPHPDEPVNAGADERTILAEKILCIVPENEVFEFILTKLASRNARLTEAEVDFLGMSVEQSSLETLISFVSNFEIPFKENMYVVAEKLFRCSERFTSSERVQLLYNICKHTGDVYNFISYMLDSSENVKFRTSEKKILVRLFEMFSAADFEDNAIQTLKKGRRFEFVCRMIDFSTYARSAGHLLVLNNLRNGKLRSWYSKGEKLFKSKSVKVLDYYAAHPGVFLRTVSRFVKEGYSPVAIIKAVSPNVEQLSLATLANVYGFFTAEAPLRTKLTESERSAVCSVLKALFLIRLKYVETGLRGKKVFVEPGMVNLEKSIVSFPCNNICETDNSGSIYRPLLAFNVPADASAVRSFVYWDDTDRVDLDLHLVSYSDSDFDGTADSFNEDRFKHVGWNSTLREEDALVHSGDMTVSNSVEYGDIYFDSCIEHGVQCVLTYSDFYARDGYHIPEVYSKLRDAFAGSMLVPSHQCKDSAEFDTSFYDRSARAEQMQVDIKNKLYSANNCICSSNLKNHSRNAMISFVDINNRVIYDLADISSKTLTYDNYKDVVSLIKAIYTAPFTVQAYIQFLAVAQNITFVNNREEADAVLVFGNTNAENEVSFTENNFFIY